MGSAELSMLSMVSQVGSKKVVKVKDLILIEKMNHIECMTSVAFVGVKGRMSHHRSKAQYLVNMISQLSTW